MKTWKKILIALAVILLLALFGVSMYGMGTDILEHFPAWLNALVLGTVYWCIGITLILIFSLGIYHIRGWFKEMGGDND